MEEIMPRRRSALYTPTFFLFACVANAATPVITVSGNVDASNVMTINPASVSWTHNTGIGTTSLLVNGTSWNPTAQPNLNLPGPLLPDPLSNYFVNTTVISGREIANAQIVGNQVLFYIDDTASGADNYSAQITFTPKPAPQVSPSATLHITGNIDGSDFLSISNTSATWTHKAWGSPSNVELNDLSWDTVNEPTMLNQGSTTYLPAGVDLSTVVFTRNTGRDTATYQVFPDHLEVYFGDDQPGSSLYDVTLSFGSVPEPTAILPILFIGFAAITKRTVRHVR
jgi:hypothetical protein